MIESMAKGLRALSIGQENAAAKSAPGGTGIVRQAAGTLDRHRPHAGIFSALFECRGAYQRLDPIRSGTAPTLFVRIHNSKHEANDA